ncbi:hypothetical protein D9M68_902010 [compost metagenome]
MHRILAGIQLHRGNLLAGDGPGMARLDVGDQPIVLPDGFGPDDGLAQPRRQIGEVILPGRQIVGGQDGRDCLELVERPIFRIRIGGGADNQVGFERQDFLDIGRRAQHGHTSIEWHPGANRAVAIADQRQAQRHGRFQIGA